MSSKDLARAVAAIALADAILVEFNDSNSKLKGFATGTMQKLLEYRQIAERADRRQSSALKRKAEAAEPVPADSIPPTDDGSEDA